MRNRTLVHASVFSGIGGAEVAAEAIGWRNVFHCETNKFCRKVLHYWFPDSKQYTDVKQTDFKRWRGKVDVLTGGFPCQPFSKAGERRGAGDDRYFWPEMLRVIQEVRPTWYIGENVVGIASMVEPSSPVEVGYQTNLFGEVDRVHRYELRQSFTLERICSDLEGAGYDVQTFCIPVASVGACHRRNRYYIIAYDKDSVRDGLRDDEELEHIKGRRHAGPEGSRRKAPAGIGFRTVYRPSGWRPSVSPVYGRDYGIPFPLDDLTIPENRWRVESLQAYGNAMSPVMMYELFHAIDRIEHESEKDLNRKKEEQ